MIYTNFWCFSGFDKLLQERGVLMKLNGKCLIYASHSRLQHYLVEHFAKFFCNSVRNAKKYPALFGHLPKGLPYPLDAGQKFFNFLWAHS
jgi:hypothetical protein